jgi:hypothetical protein
MDIILSGNIDRHNPKFFAQVMSKLKEYPYHRITRRESEPLSKIVVSHFGLNDKFQLKDKFEGEAFYKNASCVFASILSINKLINLNFDLSSITISTLNNPVLEINGKNYRIVNFSFGQMPRFTYNEDWINDGLIFSLHRDEYSCYICGFIGRDLLIEKYESVKFDVTSTKVNVKEFVDFDLLKSIMTFENK